MVPFLKLNNGMPQLPLGGGYSNTPTLPAMRAAAFVVAPAGEGPIASGEGINRHSFLSHPPMGSRGPSGLARIIAENAQRAPWLY